MPREKIFYSSKAYLYIAKPVYRLQPIKIGVTSNLNHLPALLAYSPVQLKCIVAFKFLRRWQAIEIVHSMHDQFKQPVYIEEIRMRGKWLKLDPNEAVQFITDTARAKQYMFVLSKIL